MKISDRIKKYIYKKYPNLLGELNFTLNCRFGNTYKIFEEDFMGNHLVKVPMKNGKIAIYKLTSTEFCPVFESTGQEDLHYEFIKYKEE